MIFFSPLGTLNKGAKQLQGARERQTLEGSRVKGTSCDPSLPKR